MARARLGAGTLLACLTLAVSASGQDFETTEIADGVYQFRWVGHNGFFVVTPAGVVAFDPISVDAARTYAAEIRRVAPGTSLAAIVYSHSDADHATGAGTLVSAMGQESVPIIAHEAAAAPIRERGSPDQPLPTVTFAERLSFEVGGRAIELHYLGPSHTDNLVVGYVPDVRVAFAVDFVSNDRVGFRDLPGWHFPEFFDALSGILSIPFDTIVFGHGPPGDRATVHRQITYYDDLASAVREAVRSGLSEDEAAGRVRLPEYADFEQYEAWFPLNVRAVHRWLASTGGSD